MTLHALIPSRPRNPLVESLIDSLRSERRLIDELTAIMHRQREAVAADDLQGVDDSVYAVQKVLLTLGEARKRRHSLNTRLGFAEDIPLRDLIEVMGDAAPEALRAAGRQLQETARTLAGEVATNRQVLRESLASTDAWVRTLSGPAAPTAGYGESLTGASRQPKLINRRA